MVVIVSRRPSRYASGLGSGSSAWAVALIVGGLIATVPSAVLGQVSGAPQISVSADMRGTVRGRLGDPFGGRLERLGDAFVELRTVDGVYSVRSGIDGSYELTGLPTGPARLKVMRIGHEPLELSVRLPEHGVLELDVELTAVPMLLPGVSVQAGRRQGMSSLDDSTLPAPDPAFELRRLELSPGVIESGVLEAVAGMPGNDPADPSDVLFMRGSTTDMKLVLLDGVPVYAPFHVGGLLESFEPSMLASADFHVGGAPARYDGGLTHILDLRTRTARRDRARASATLDLLSSAAVVEQPLGESAGLLLSGRSLHEAGTAMLGGGRSPYGYHDVLATVDADLGTVGSVRLTGFRNRESVVLDFPNGPGDARWGNGAFSGTLRSHVGSVEMQATVGASQYDARLPLQPSPKPDHPAPSAILATANNERTRLAVEAAWREGDVPIRAGVAFEDQTLAYAADRIDGSSRLGRAGRRTVFGTFVDGSTTVARGVAVRAGLRADVFGGDRVRLAPRASITIDVGPTSLLTLAVGRYHQMTRLAIDTGVEESLEQFAGSGLDETLPVATADHVVLSMAQRPSESVSLNVGGYFKRFSGIESGGGALQNSGLDLQVVGVGDRSALWLGYGLSWFWSDDPGSRSASDFAGRHLITLGLNGSLAGPVKIEARLSYGAGLPSTGIPFGSADALTPIGGAGDESSTGGVTTDPGFLLDESFLRLDVELHTLIERNWLGQEWRFRPFLRVLNALDRRDALFYAYQPWRSDDVTPLAVRPILPVFGLSIAH